MIETLQETSDVDAQAESLLVNAPVQLQESVRGDSHRQIKTVHLTSNEGSSLSINILERLENDQTLRAPVSLIPDNSPEVPADERVRKTASDDTDWRLAAGVPLTLTLNTEVQTPLVSTVDSFPSLENSAPRQPLAIRPELRFASVQGMWTTQPIRTLVTQLKQFTGELGAASPLAPIAGNLLATERTSVGRTETENPNPGAVAAGDSQEITSKPTPSAVPADISTDSKGDSVFAAVEASKTDSVPDVPPVIAVATQGSMPVTAAVQEASQRIQLAPTQVRTVNSRVEVAELKSLPSGPRSSRPLNVSGEQAIPASATVPGEQNDFLWNTVNHLPMEVSIDDSEGIRSVQPAPRHLTREVPSATQFGSVLESLPPAVDVRSESSARLEPRTIEQIVSSAVVESRLVEEGGSQRFQIRLDPPELGGITIEIHRSASGELAMHISAASGETHALLDQHASELTQALNDQGLALSHFDLSQHHRGTSPEEMLQFRENFENSQLAREARDAFSQSESHFAASASHPFSFRA
ncbi:flagellar hook-length control protein FliK [Planctomicrobium sp. SH661]|uniref:flagellar hook-length control protein FliK n=1 Tax=Planctomicrobium sp. SH661 TaxID=3448124 RepID=UPI003F5C0CEE